MKTGACPKCKSRELYEIEEVLTPDHRTKNTLYPLGISAAYGMYGKDMANERIAVHVSACVCAKCGFTEMYAKDLSVLERLERTNAGGVRKVTR